MNTINWDANDPASWPVITKFYRYRSPYGTTICTAYRYHETRPDYTLIETISDTYCYVCDTSVTGGFGITFYTRDAGDNNTILRILCVGCVTAKPDDNKRLLTWYSYSLLDYGDPLDRIAPDSPDLLTTLNEYYNALWLMKIRPHSSRKYQRLLKFAKKL